MNIFTSFGFCQMAVKPTLLLLSCFLLMSANTGSSEKLKGIDVSRYQRMVNWDTMKKDNISFAFIKATEGGHIKDPYFARNWKHSQSNGIKRGAYHFFIPWVDAQAQVAHFTSVVTLEPGDLPPVLDVETFAPEVTDEELHEGIRTWLTLAEQHYGVKPIIYTNQTYYNRKLKGHFSGYPFWIAKYHHTKPNTHPEDEMLFWQYSERGRLRGVDGAVDLNYFYGGLAALESLCVPIPSVEPEETLAQQAEPEEAF